MKPAIVVHGGTHTLDAAHAQEYKAGCAQAAQHGWCVLQAGGTALDAVEAALRVLESNPLFNAGYGAQLNMVGMAELDAVLMEGAQLRSASVVSLRRVRHPITLAHKALLCDPPERTAQVSGHRAASLARQYGLELCDSGGLICEPQRQRWMRSRAPTPRYDAVGCVALDSEGHLAAGVSSGGAHRHLPGHRCESTLVESSLYVDDRLGACLLLGNTAQSAHIALAREAVELLASASHPDAAAVWAVQTLEERAGIEGGCVLLDARGRFGWAHHTPHMVCAHQRAEMNRSLAFINKVECQSSAECR